MNAMCDNGYRLLMSWIERNMKHLEVRNIWRLAVTSIAHLYHQRQEDRLWTISDYYGIQVAIRKLHSIVHLLSVLTSYRNCIRKAPIISIGEYSFSLRQNKKLNLKEKKKWRWKRWKMKRNKNKAEELPWHWALASHLPLPTVHCWSKQQWKGHSYISIHIHRHPLQGLGSHTSWHLLYRPGHLCRVQCHCRKSFALLVLRMFHIRVLAQIEHSRDTFAVLICVGETRRKRRCGKHAWTYRAVFSTNDKG